MRKLAVGYPWTSPFMWTPFVESTINLRHPEGCEVRYFRGAGWCPARRHIDLCQQAVDWGAELICIIGADQAHPEDMLVRLVDRFNSGCEVVAALVPVRGYVAWQDMRPFQPMAWRFKTNDEMGTTAYRQYRNMHDDADMIHVVKRSDGELVRTNFIGSGVLMFHESHLRALKKPWFYETLDNPEDYTRIANMDCTFVWRLQAEAGATVWVDTTIMVKHVHEFEIDDSYSERFKDWKRPGVGDKDICVFRDEGPSGKTNIHRRMQ